jgi:Zn-dependent peptidase ImmA (M78 family)
MKWSSYSLWPTMRRVERAAFSTVTTCMKCLKLDEVPVPIPVESWIEGPLGIRFGVTDLRHLGPEVLGAVFVSEREILVSDRIAGEEGRFRFTAAHELGHLVLHSRLSRTFHETSDVPEFIDRRIEREADRFAAAFLMPLPALHNELLAACGSDVHRLLEAVSASDQQALRDFRQDIVPRLAKRFAVSVSATIRRFADVQIPSGRQVLPNETLTVMLAPKDQAHRTFPT